MSEFVLTEFLILIVKEFTPRQTPWHPDPNHLNLRVVVVVPGLGRVLRRDVMNPTTETRRSNRGIPVFCHCCWKWYRRSVLFYTSGITFTIKKRLFFWKGPEGGWEKFLEWKHGIISINKGLEKDSVDSRSSCVSGTSWTWLVLISGKPGLVPGSKGFCVSVCTYIVLRWLIFWTPLPTIYVLRWFS